MRPPADARALLVGDASPRELAASLEQAGITPVYATPAEAPAALSAAVQDGHPPAICVVTACEDPLGLVRALRRRWAGGVLLACPPERLPDLRR